MGRTAKDISKPDGIVPVRPQQNVSTAAPEKMSPDQIMTGIMRKGSDINGHWRRCRVMVCRRARRCAGRDLVCLRNQPRVPASPEEMVQAMAELRRMLEAEMARRGFEP